MKNIAIFTLLIALSSFSCSSTLPKGIDIQNIFNNKTPHEKYADKVDETPEGSLWLAASEKALIQPQSIKLPYRQHGYFHADKPRSMGIQFNAKFGERLTFNLTKKTGTDLVVYADLYKQDGSGSAHLLSADTASSEFSFDVEETGTYVLRLQPELYQAGSYNLSISIGPSLDFPVSGNKAKAGSFWGASRDGGKRKHEGIDIFATKLTPAIAAADGYITGVKEGGIGGKVVWMKTDNMDVHLYYAHLDKQLVHVGQSVKKGDTLGLVGNTGNARYTPSHLHFGVYTFRGPVGPLPFVDKAVKTAPAVPEKNLKTLLTLIKSQKTKSGSLVKANTELVPLAVTSKGYLVELPDGNTMQAPFTSVKATKLSVESIATGTATESEPKKS
jgi:peptidoglycan LD-endopeptidase LytH